MSRPRTREQWFHFHLARFQDAAQRPVQLQFSAEVAAAQSQLKEAEARVSAARQAEPLSSKLASRLGVATTYRRAVLGPAVDAERAAAAQLDAVRRSLRIALDGAARAGAESYREQRVRRKTEAAQRAARVAARKHEKRLQYLERSPAIRSAGRFLKIALILQSRPDNGIVGCYYCGIEVPLSSIHLEHKRPICRGGTNHRGNLVLACAKCNLSKGRRTHEEFLRKLGRGPSGAAG